MTREPPETAGESLHQLMVFNARDWAANKTDAWLWGVVVGWDQNSLDELAPRFGWSPDHVLRLQRLHADFISRVQS